MSGDRAHTSTGRWIVPLCGAALLVLAATACGSDGDESTDADGTPAEGSVGPQPPVTIADEGDPQIGGKVIYALNGESDGWDPANNRWAVSGTQVGLTFYDALSAFDADGVAQPYLAESFEHSDDYRQWTVTVRDNVQFHDGTTLDAEALRVNLQTIRDSLLSGSAVQPIENIEVVGDRSVRVDMSVPWVVYPAVLTGQAGVVVEPEALTSGAASRDPIGTGPFVFDNWSPDNSLVVTRNDTYWRDGLPYLDEVEFKPVPDTQTRAAGMKTGDFDMMFTTDPANIVEFRKLAADGDVQMVEDTSEPGESHVILNTLVEPLDDVRIRQAIAYATDQDQIIEVTGEGIYEKARGPYPPSSKWYAESDYPEYDPDKARELVDEYIADNGELPAFELTTTPVAANLRIVELLSEQWRQVGITANANSIDEASFILSGVSGDYDANVWGNFNAPDPDVEWHWWHGTNAKPIGDIALNFTRLDDAELNEAIDTGRQSPDEDVRLEAYATAQQRMGEQADKIWLYHLVVAVVADNDVRGITNGPLPDGEPSLPMGGSFNGATRMTQVWIAG
jgi:ABC-type transport system substrate-binding protein